MRGFGFTWGEGVGVSHVKGIWGVRQRTFGVSQADGIGSLSGQDLGSFRLERFRMLRLTGFRILRLREFEVSHSKIWSLSLMGLRFSGMEVTWGL